MRPLRPTGAQASKEILRQSSNRACAEKGSQLIKPHLLYKADGRNNLFHLVVSLQRGVFAVACMACSVDNLCIKCPQVIDCGF